MRIALGLSSIAGMAIAGCLIWLLLIEADNIDRRSSFGRDLFAHQRPAAAADMTARPIPQRRWRSYGDEPLPTGREALDEPLAAFQSWFMRITCDRCGKDRMLNEVTPHCSSAP